MNWEAYSVVERNPRNWESSGRQMELSMAVELAKTGRAWLNLCRLADLTRRMLICCKVAAWVREMLSCKHDWGDREIHFLSPIRRKLPRIFCEQISLTEFRVVEFSRHE